MKKRLLVLPILIMMIMTSGCSIFEEPETDMSEPIYKADAKDVEYLFESQKEDVATTEYDEDDTGVYYLDHTTSDLVSFTDEVDVATASTIAIYNADTHELTLNEDFAINDSAKYMYVEPDPISSTFMFQRITEKKKDDKGRAVAVLSGVPLIEELNPETYNSLFVSYELAGVENIPSIDNTKLPKAETLPIEEYEEEETEEFSTENITDNTESEEPADKEKEEISEEKEENSNEETEEKEKDKE